MVDLGTKQAVNEWLHLVDCHLNVLKANIKNEFAAQKIFNNTKNLAHKPAIKEEVKSIISCANMISQYLCKDIGD